MKLLLIVFTLFLFVGCASIEKAPLSRDAVAKNFKPSSELAVVYFYRDNIVNSVVAMDILINGRYIGKMRSGHYMRVELRPGQYTITSRASNDKSIKLTTQAGKIYFIQQIGVFKFLAHGTDLKLVDAEEGKKAVLNNDLVEQTDSFDQ